MRSRSRCCGWAPSCCASAPGGFAARRNAVADVQRHRRQHRTARAACARCPRASHRFDVPGVGHSPMPRRLYWLRTLARWRSACSITSGTRRRTCSVSMGRRGGAGIRTHGGERCRRLILCATTSGMFMLPGHPKAIARMVTPRRYMSKAYATQVSGDIYGGDFRRRPELAAEFMKHVKWQSRWGYYRRSAPRRVGPACIGCAA